MPSPSAIQDEILSYAPSIDAREGGFLFTSSDADALFRWRIMFNRLNSLRNLKDNWDGEGAESPKASTINYALEWLAMQFNAKCSPPARILPTPLGSILIEWQNEGAYIAAEITEQRKVEWMMRTKDGEISHWESDIPRDSSKGYLIGQTEEAA